MKSYKDIKERKWPWESFVNKISPNRFLLIRTKTEQNGFIYEWPRRLEGAKILSRK